MKQSNRSISPAEEQHAGEVHAGGFGVRPNQLGTQVEEEAEGLLHPGELRNRCEEKFRESREEKSV